MRNAASSISAIVVSYDTLALTLECLARLSAELDGAGDEVIVVDNASTDGSVDAIRAGLPSVRIIANATNVGFGPANNQAIAAVRGNFLLLLNSDAFVHSGAIGRLVRYLLDHPRVGVVGPRLLNEDGSLQPSAWPFPSPTRSWVEALAISPLLRWHRGLRDWRSWTYDCSGPVPWLVGACLLVRRDVIDAVGGFDESFFLYGEETEWQRRVRAAGWDVHFVADTTVTHLGGASGISQKERTRSLFFEGVDRYVRKHHGRSGLVASRAAMLVGAALRWPVFASLSILRPGEQRFRARAATLRWLIRRQATHWQGLQGQKTA